MFVDSSGIEVSSQHCAGTAWVSARLNQGGTDVKGTWREQPVLRIVRDMALAAAEWTRLDAEGREEAVLVYYRLSR